MKKVLIVIFSILLLSTNISDAKNVAYANNAEDELEQELEESIELQLDSLDLESIEEMYNQYVQIEDKTLEELIQDAINGKFTFSFTTISELIKNRITEAIKSKLNLLILILIIGFISALLNNLVISKHGESFSSAISFVFVVFVASIISLSVAEVITLTTNTMANISSLTEIICPVLLALMVSIGAVSSSAIYQPMVTALTSVVINVFSKFLLGVIIFMFALTILGSLIERFKLDKLNHFCSSIAKWVISIVFTIFLGYLSLQGITAGSADGISIKTAKYALRSYIPMVGGYLSEGFEVFRGGSVLIKNSIGVIGILILFSIVLLPLIELIALNLTFKLASAFTDMLGAGEISNLLTGVTKVFNFLVAIILAVFMMCFILLLLIIMTANMV